MARHLFVCGLIALFAVATNVATPRTTLANPVNNIASISAGDEYSCALTTGGGVKCWGDNSYGQLGNGTTSASAIASDVQNLQTGMVTVSAGTDHICGVTTAGGIKCWGLNSAGQLGDGTTTNSATPVDVIGLTSGVSAVSAGGNHTCALTTQGAVKCWGFNLYGQVGNGTNTVTGCLCIPNPVDVTGLISGAAAVSAGGNHTCAVTSAGGTKCWGANWIGQLGSSTTQVCGSRPCSTSPADVTGLMSGAISVSAGYEFSCALTTGGAGKCWGRNTEGELGNGVHTTGGTASPVDVNGLNNATFITAGGYHACALISPQHLQCWGDDGASQLGDGTQGDPTCYCRTVPTDVVGMASGSASPSAGYRHSCALSGGRAQCWGYNGFAQLGNGTTANAATPADVVFPKTVGGITSLTAAALSPERTTSYRSAAFPFAALALVGVSAAGVVWFARRRLHHSR
jgi:alpha-tubulin suppressor-like RCC1 family protein